MPDKLNIEQFAAKIRERRPDLASVPMDVLVGKTLAAAPELKEFVDLSPEANVKPVQPQAYVGRGPSGGEVAQDQAAEVLKGIPQAITGIPGAIAGGASALWQMLSGGGTGQAQDMAKSAVSPLTTSLQGAGALISPQKYQAPTDDQWKSAAQGAGAMLGGAELPNAISPLASALAKALPNKASAGANLNTVMAVAKDVPIDTTEAGNAALRADELAKTGASLPKVLRDYMKYPANTDMTYQTGRDFSSNAGALSASEKMASNPQMGAQVAKFADAMNTANRDAAASVGMGDLYDAAMKEYRQASSIGNAADVLKKWVGRAALVTALGGAGRAGYDIYSKVMH